jgi:hypothetical protein
MPKPESRRTARVACEVKTRVLVPGHWPDVVVRDFSRTGIRFAVPLASLGVEPDATLGTIAEGLRYVMDLKIMVQFDPDRLGTLVQRPLKVVRMFQTQDDAGTVQLGCTLEPPLTDEEAVALALPLPSDAAPDATRQRWKDSAAPSRPAGLKSVAPCPTAERSFSASVISRIRGTNRTLKGRTEALGTGGGTLWVSEENHRALKAFPDDLPDKVVAFESTYGADVDVSIERDNRYLFYGPVRIVGVETIPTLPGRLVLGFAFGRDLSREECEALQIG